MERRSVAVFAVHPGPPPRVLLLHRVPAKGGGWQPVTGRVEDGESVEAAARRELREETGLPAARLVDLGVETRFRGYDGVDYAERAFLALVATDAFARSDEHDDARFVSLEDADGMLRWDENRVALRAAREAMGADPRLQVGEGP